MLIVVSGHSRGVGKTSLVEAILKVVPHHSFSTLKISVHRHGGTEALCPVKEDAGRRGDRLLKAGARSAWLLRAGNETLPRALRTIEDLLSTAPNWIVESNRVVAYLQPDMLLFVCHPEIVDWKASADACLASCDAVVFRSAAWAEGIQGRVLPERARRLIQPEPGVLAPESARWLARRIDGLDSGEAADQGFMAARPCLV